MSIEQIRRSDIRADQTQSRAKIDGETLHDYADLMRDGVVLPPLVVFLDGESYWLADGFHRLFAAQNLGLEFVECDVRKGTVRDALMFSLGANTDHGLRRTYDDKRRAVAIALSDDEWGKCSDRKIAEMCVVSHGFVATVREASRGGNVTTSSKNPIKTRVGRDGKRQAADKKPAKKAATTKPPKPGAQKSDPRLWDRWEDAFGKLRRLADDLNRSYPHANNHRALVANLNAAHNAATAWKKAVRT